MPSRSLRHQWQEKQQARTLDPVPLFDSPIPAQRNTPRILVLSVSAGHGHVRAAEALCAYAANHKPALHLHHVDMVSLAPSLFRTLYVDAYLALVRHLPRVWGWLYRTTDRVQPNRTIESVRRLVQAGCTHGLRHEISRFAPDAIVCTHFLPAELLAAQIRHGRLSCPVWVQITDFDLHRMWLHEGIAGYFVATSHVAWRLRTQGVAASRIHVTGIPVMPDFMAQPPRALSTAQSKVRQVVIILMGGGAGFGGLDDIARQLLSLDTAIALVVLAGKNNRLLQTLQAMTKSYPTRLRVSGFTDRVPELMGLADIAITKPGGLSSAECMAMGLPMILINPVPGQEDRNSDYLLQQGVALRAEGAHGLALCVQSLLGDRDALARMRLRALQIGRPEAGKAILSQLSTQLQSRRAT